jgi:hypothetical protein
MRKPIGRPIELSALTKDGIRFMVWISLEEKKFLHEKAKHLRISKSELIRRMIQKEMNQ